MAPFSIGKLNSLTLGFFRLIIPIAGWVVAPYAAYGGDPGTLEYKPYLMPNGAPIAAVNAIVEDVDGAIWVATWGEGVHCIDGTTWTTFGEKDGLPDDWVRTLSASQSGGIWVGTGDGLAYIQGDVVQSLTPENLPLLPNPDIFFIRELNDGRVWVSVQGGGLLERAAGGLDDISVGWKSLASPKITGGQPVSQLIEFGPNEVLVANTWRGLAWVRDGQWIPDQSITDNAWHTLFSGVRNGEPLYLVASQDGTDLYQFETDHWSAPETGPPDINEIAIDAEGTLYAATKRGLYSKKNGDWLPTVLPPDLGVPLLQQVLVARNGVVWLGGNEGLIRGAPHSWTDATTADGPTAFVPRTGKGDPVLALNGQGEIFSWRDKAWQRSLQLAPWRSAAWRADGALWMGDGQGWVNDAGEYQWIMVHDDALYRIHDQTLSIVSVRDGHVIRDEKLPPLAGLGARGLITSDGRILALTSQHAFRLEDGQWQPYPAYSGYKHKLINAIRETEPGVIWVAVEGGLERWTKEEVRYFGGADGLNPSDDIHAVCRAQSGEIWFASSGSGVYRYDGQHFQQFTKANGLRSNTVRNIAESNDGTIWVAYRGSGVSAFRHDRWVNFMLESGLPGVPVLAFAEPEPGEWWVFTTNPSLYRFTPELLPPETKLVVAPRNVDSHGVGVFSFGGQDVWNQTKNLLYSWRILPGDTAKHPEIPWSTFSAETTVATPPLAPGRHRLELRSSDENGNVDPDPVVHTFDVAPPLWRKPVFFVPVFCSVVLALIAILARNRSHRALRQSEAQLQVHRHHLEELVQERTHDLELAQEELIRKERLATLGELTATVSHELRNPLGTIQSSLYTIEKRAAGKGLGIEQAIERSVRSVRRCDHIVEEMLDFTRSHAIEPAVLQWDLWLHEAISEYSLPPEITLKWDLKSNVTVAIDVELMRRALINILDNAVQSMESLSSGAKVILVTLTSEEERAHLYIDDSGPGIPDEVLNHILEPLFSTKNFGVGLGTNIVKNIMERHSGGVVYGNVPGSGARVELWLPLAESGQGG